jgi:hypothetical protein
MLAVVLFVIAAVVGLLVMVLPPALLQDVQKRWAFYGIMCLVSALCVCLSAQRRRPSLLALFPFARAGRAAGAGVLLSDVCSKAATPCVPAANFYETKLRGARRFRRTAGYWRLEQARCDGARMMRQSSWCEQGSRRLPSARVGSCMQRVRDGVTARREACCHTAAGGSLVCSTGSPASLGIFKSINRLI